MSAKVRPFFALFLALALVVGSAAQGVQGSGMAAKMTAAATSDMPMPDGCGGCGGVEYGMPMACLAFCSGCVAAILTSSRPVAAGAVIFPSAPPAVSVAGHHGPPDPYPPRPAILI